IGLMTKLDRVHAAWLLARLDDPNESIEAKRWCIWAMTRHDDASVDVAFDAVLTKLPGTSLISQVLGNSAYAQRSGGANWLVDVLRYHPDVRDWPGYRALSQLPEQGLYGSTPRRLAMETRVAAALALAEQPIPSDAEDQRFVLSQLLRRMVPGNSAQAMDFNRGFDTIAYFMHCDGTQSDRDLLYNQLRGFASLLSDDPGVLAELEEGEEPTQKDLFVRQSDNEVRGYAALATGLLIRRATEGTALNAQRPVSPDRAIEIERLKRRFGTRLMRAVANGRESKSYRAACALALGLSGDVRYKAELSIELGNLQAGDEVVLGYGLLALAMLGEERVVDPATRYLTRPGQVVGVDDLLGRRAAMRALALVGEGSGDPLAQVWGRNRWVSLHAADAAAWGGEYDAVPAMLNGLQSESVVWRRTAAASLGRTFDAAWPSRLSALTEGSNPTLSLRTMTAGQPQPGSIIEADERRTAAWPMGEVYALSDPFFIALKQGVFTPKPADDQDAR
ncbi:MAG: HEAT repeat domain-containing protein, partial [Phycisphaeraceae bacterium]